MDNTIKYTCCGMVICMALLFIITPSKEEVVLKLIYNKGFCITYLDNNNKKCYDVTERKE